MKLVIAIVLSLFTGAAFAQQPPSTEQALRQVNAFLAQDNARLAQENEMLKQRLQQLEAQKPPPEKK